MNAMIVAMTGIILRGPLIVRMEQATTIDKGFYSAAVAPTFGLPSPTLIWTDQEFGLWNGCEVEIPEGMQITITPSMLPFALRWRLEVNGVRRTPGDGYTGFRSCDQNLDGVVDGIDSDLFNNWFEAGSERADFNGDGFIDGLDKDAFDNEFGL